MPASYKRVVITGAGSGIGAALANAFAARGADVVVADVDEQAAVRTASTLRHRAAANEILVVGTDEARLGTRVWRTRSPPDAHAAVSDLDEQAANHLDVRGDEIEHGKRALAVRCDVTSADEVERLAELAWAGGEVDLWINNAGIAIGGAAQELSLADWRRVLDVNLSGVVHGVHAAYPRMIAQRRGHIVNIASVAGLAPYPLALPYTTSKHAVVGMSLALRAEARAHGVRVGVACPGMIKTPIWERSEVRGSLANGRSKMLERIAGAMTAEDCAAAIVRGIDANRAVIPVTAEARIAWWLTRASPALASVVASGVAALANRLGAGTGGASSTRAA